MRARLRGAPGVEPEPIIVEDEDEIDNDEGTLTRQAFSSETPACDSQQSFVYPRTARNRGRQWRFVINVPGEEVGEENYVQAIQIQIQIHIQIQIQMQIQIHLQIQIPPKCLGEAGSSKEDDE